MNADFFFKFAKFKLGKKVNADDFTDKLNYQWTSFFLILFVAVIGIKQYVFTPIQCWVPPEWPKAWEDYAENYCWVQDTYFANVSSTPLPNVEVRRDAQISYYQWVPFILAIQALFFYMPHLMWKMMSGRAGYDVNQIVKFASDASSIDQEKRKKMIGFLARQLSRSLDSKHQAGRVREFREGIGSKLKSILPCFWMANTSGGFLIGLYLTIKCVYVLNTVGQLFLMQKFLGFDSPLFGWTVASNLARGRYWADSGMFPRVTYCDVPIRRIGQPVTRTIQCVLPTNMLNEKLYIFLWFWIVLCGIMSVVSFFTWILRSALASNRSAFIKKHLKLLETLKNTHTNQARRFVKEFLRHDGVFIMRMVAANVGEVMAADIMDEVWKKWVEEDEKNNDEEVPSLIRDQKKPSAPPGSRGSGNDAPTLRRPNYDGPKSFV